MAYTTINKPSQYFNTVLYTGTQTQQTINVGFQPDFVWIKSRSNIQVHALFDAVRGVSIGALQSNDTAAENANQKLVAYTSTGFTLPSVNYEWTNTNGWTFASWNWLGANTTVSNTQGSISSTVSANTTSGFSVVNWTGSTSSSAQTVGHGLGVTPKMIILKNRDSVDNWFVYHASVTNTSQNLYLNTTAALTTQGAALWGAGMTSTLVGVRPATFCATTNDDVIMYCFAEVKGYSKFGSYTGNGSADGTFVYTGFKPAMVICKKTNASGTNWGIIDNKRANSFNVISAMLNPNSSGSEGANNNCDFVSNGFKWKSSDGNSNASSDTYIYAAFAENPFVSSTLVPTTAR